MIDFIEYKTEIIITFVIVSCILVGYLITKGKHYYKIKQGERILKKIRSFNGDNQEERILNYLKKINPFTFEELLLSLFKESGCKIKRNKKYTGDGGIDGKFKYNGSWYFVQAKRYSNYIKNTDVEAFSNICIKNNVRGLFIHTGKTGKSSHNIASLNENLLIIEPHELIKFIKTGKLKISKI